MADDIRVTDGAAVPSILSIRSLQKSFDSVCVLQDISLSVDRGNVISIIGPSGSGKSTLLRCAVFLETADGGDILYDGQYALRGGVYAPKAELARFRRRFGLVFQNFQLFPHYSVMKNITEAPILQGIDREEARERGYELLKKMGLEGKENAYPYQLSGGQQQRVAIARALINEPKVLLLDEPLGALDLKLRKDMQNELKNIQAKTGITFVYVTHDQEEALSMSDTVVVMADGKIQQIGTPTDIYNEPVNAFVADFIGESNILDGVMVADYKARFAGHTFECLDKGFSPMEKVDIVVRPEDVDVVTPEKGMLQGVVTGVTFKGVHWEIIVDIQGFKWMIQTTDYSAPDTTIGLYIEPDAIHVMKKSEYSNMFGDYSSFSDEFDELSDVESVDEEEAKEE